MTKPRKRSPSRGRTQRRRYMSPEGYEIELVMGDYPRGYLWIGQPDDGMDASLSERQLDSLAKAWCRYRGIKP